MPPRTTTDSTEPRPAVAAQAGRRRHRRTDTPVRSKESSGTHRSKSSIPEAFKDNVKLIREMISQLPSGADKWIKRMTPSRSPPPNGGGEKPESLLKVLEFRALTQQRRMEEAEAARPQGGAEPRSGRLRISGTATNAGNSDQPIAEETVPMSTARRQGDQRDKVLATVPTNPESPRYRRPKPQSGKRQALASDLSSELSREDSQGPRNGPRGRVVGKTASNRASERATRSRTERPPREKMNRSQRARGSADPPSPSDASSSESDESSSASWLSQLGRSTSSRTPSEESDMYINDPPRREREQREFRGTAKSTPRLTQQEIKEQKKPRARTQEYKIAEKIPKNSKNSRHSPPPREQPRGRKVRSTHHSGDKCRSSRSTQYVASSSESDPPEKERRRDRSGGRHKKIDTGTGERSGRT